MQTLDETPSKKADSKLHGDSRRVLLQCTAEFDTYSKWDAGTFHMHPCISQGFMPYLYMSCVTKVSTYRKCLICVLNVLCQVTELSLYQLQ